MPLTESASPLVLTLHQRCDTADSLAGQADARALDRFGLERALRHHLLPLASAGSVTPVAAESPREFLRMEPVLRCALGPVTCRLAPRAAIEGELLNLRQAYLARRAEHRAAPKDSCRTWSSLRAGAVLFGLVGVLAGLGWFSPSLLVWLLVGWTALTLVAVTGLRSVAAGVHFFERRRAARLWTSVRSRSRRVDTLPRVSLLVPLYRERDIAARLVARLERLDYPRNRLEVCLILEWGDRTTETALRDADLPDWMRIVRVPQGQLRTKPRAMNYALDFLTGDIIGIYDAEDAPAPDQLRRVVEALRKAPHDVACVQGVLDFYNARSNLLTRCFAIDYAAWFRLVLPGFQRLGLVVPLGGTTVFFRRSVLDALGRWDAHNVTEDAELGLRLARFGYRCELLPTVTREEATASIPAWIRQRSRWIKGYAMTWAVHMRDPLKLLGDLGPLRFLGVQVLFLGTLSQFLLAPLLWSFWLILFGLPHPLTDLAPWGVVIGLGALFFVCEVATMLVAAAAVSGPEHRWLIKWVPLLHLYFPLAAFASWKAFAELVARPFFWDKTAHGKDRERSWAFRDLAKLGWRRRKLRHG